MARRKKRKYPQQTRVYQFGTTLIGLTYDVMRYRRFTQYKIHQNHGYSQEKVIKKKEVFEKRRENLAKAFRYAVVMEKRYSGSVFVKLVKLYDLFCRQMNIGYVYTQNAFSRKKFDDVAINIFISYVSVSNREAFWRCLLKELTSESLRLHKEECQKNDIQQMLQSLDSIDCMIRNHPKQEDESDVFRGCLVSNFWMEFVFEVDRAKFYLDKTGNIINRKLSDEIQIVLYALNAYMPKPCVWGGLAEGGDTVMAERLVYEGFRHCEERRHELENLTGKLMLELKARGEKIKLKEGPAKGDQLKTVKNEPKGRGKGVLEEHIKPLIKTDPTITNEGIADLLNERWAKKHTPTSASSVGKTRRQLKQNKR